MLVTVIAHNIFEFPIKMIADSTLRFLIFTLIFTLILLHLLLPLSPFPSLLRTSPFQWSHLASLPPSPTGVLHAVAVGHEWLSDRGSCKCRYPSTACCLLPLSGDRTSRTPVTSKTSSP
jgi:hypothetical protein